MAAGFTFDDIKGFTLGQVRAFLSAAERQAREQRLGDAIAARMAQADGKDWKAYTRKLGER